jgi:O-antigen/teichoic acid export membrane protein
MMSRINAALAKLPRQTLIRLGWATGSFGLIQVMRLLNNVVLARLLSPPLFGLMLIVNSIRTGVELLSDVGINQNIVSNRQGDRPEFYDTAWTIKVMRGIALGAVCFLSASLFAEFFETPELAIILPVIALTFVFLGFQSASASLLQKQRSVARNSVLDLSVAAISLGVHIALALVTPTIWALVLGSVFTSAAALVASYLVVPGRRHRFIIDRVAARQILKFGKWIFISSIIYFAAVNFDRLYLAKQISLAMLGIYSIARSMADMMNMLVIRVSYMVLFPTVAAMDVSAPELRAKLLHARRIMLSFVAVGLACFVAVSDLVVQLLYDVRYETAGAILPVMLLGVWMSILSVVNDSVLLGTGKPAYTTIANAAKLLTFVVGVPLGFQFGGLLGAVVVLNAGEVMRYVVLWIFSRKQHLAFGREDLGLTLLFLVSVLAAREALSALGLTTDITSLFPFLDPSWWSK